MPRLTAAAATSRPVHGLSGRSEACGGSQATARIWPTASGVIRAGAPRRGASARRAAGEPAAAVAQRVRQQLSRSTSEWRWRAMAALVAPAAAARITRARRASACGVCWARTSPSSARRSASVRVMATAAGPGIGCASVVRRRATRRRATRALTSFTFASARSEFCDSITEL